jgi:hypothetical protein
MLSLEVLPAIPEVILSKRKKNADDKRGTRNNNKAPVIQNKESCIRKKWQAFRTLVGTF